MANGFKGRAWTVVLAGTGINLALGILYTWSVFKGAIAQEDSGFGWDKGALNDPYALCCLVFAYPRAPKSGRTARIEYVANWSS